MRRPRFVIEQGASGAWHFTLVAPNGEIVLQSETYPTKRLARKGIAAFKRYALQARIVQE
jgi:uncharacterized protein YegP (UPF0339 family)